MARLAARERNDVIGLWRRAPHRPVTVLRHKKLPSVPQL